MKKSSTLFGDFILFIVAIIWGGGFVAGKLALTDLSPIAVLMYRFVLSAISVGLLFFKHIRKCKKQEIQFGVLLGVLMYSGLLIQLFGLKYTTASKQSFIVAAYCIFTPLLNFLLFKEKPSKKDFISSIVILLGIALISLNGISHIQSGDFISLGFTIIFALQIIIISKYTKALSAVNLTFFQLLTAAACSLIVVWVLKIPIALQSGYGLYGVLYLALINTAVAMVLQNYGQKFTTETHAALLLSLESVFGFIFSVMIFHDPITIKIFAGCVIVFSGVLIAKLEP